MEQVNFADLDQRFEDTPPELVGMYPLGGGGLLEAPYRHHFESVHFKKIVRLTRTMHVLELGSGNGRWATEIAPLVSSYTGVDVTPRALEIARNAVKCRGIRNCQFLEASILDFKGNGKVYDLVYFSGVSQYLDDQQLSSVISNLLPCMAESVIIVDRSSINYGNREVIEWPGYYTILRTHAEMGAAMSEYGFHMTYARRSYRFLRGARYLQASHCAAILLKLSSATRPLSLYLMLLASFVADCLRPKSRGKGDWDHVFFRFDRKK